MVYQVLSIILITVNCAAMQQKKQLSLEMKELYFQKTYPLNPDITPKPNERISLNLNRHIQLAIFRLYTILQLVRDVSVEVDVQGPIQEIVSSIWRGVQGVQPEFMQQVDFATVQTNLQRAATEVKGSDIFGTIVHHAEHHLLHLQMILQYTRYFGMQFQILELLGAGSFGSVWKVFYQGTHHAFKFVMKQAWCMHEESIMRTLKRQMPDNALIVHIQHEGTFDCAHYSGFLMQLVNGVQSSQIDDAMIDEYFGGDSFKLVCQFGVDVNFVLDATKSILSHNDVTKHNVFWDFKMRRFRLMDWNKGHILADNQNPVFFGSTNSFGIAGWKLHMQMRIQNTMQLNDETKWLAYLNDRQSVVNVQIDLLYIYGGFKQNIPNEELRTQLREIYTSGQNALIIVNDLLKISSPNWEATAFGRLDQLWVLRDRFIVAVQAEFGLADGSPFAAIQGTPQYSDLEKLFFQDFSGIRYKGNEFDALFWAKIGVDIGQPVPDQLMIIERNFVDKLLTASKDHVFGGDQIYNMLTFCFSAMPSFLRGSHLAIDMAQDCNGRVYDKQKLYIAHLTLKLLQAYLHWTETKVECVVEGPISDYMGHLVSKLDVKDYQSVKEQLNQMHGIPICDKINSLFECTSGDTCMDDFKRTLDPTLSANGRPIIVTP